jgi:hypothetical protein
LHNLALTATDDDDDDDNDTEVHKIRALYQRQSREYFFKSRQALVSAMTLESARDHHHHHDDPPKSDSSSSSSTSHAAADRKMICETLSDVNAMDRLTLFARLFAREFVLLQLLQSSSPNINSEKKKTNNDEDGNDATKNNNVQEQQSSLEERLLKLNQSLPSAFKTSEERMRDINRGLNRLGLSSLVTTTTNTNSSSSSNKGRSFSTMPMTIKSELEQVEDIIAQARDEVALQQQQYGIPDSSINNNIGKSGIGASAGVGSSVGGSSSTDHLAQNVAAAAASTNLARLGDDKYDIDDDDSLSASLHDQEDESETFVDLTADDIRAIQDYVNEAQSQLAQLNVMLQVDSTTGQNAEIEFDPSSGRHKLLQARKCLAQANRRFAVLEE